MFLIEKKLERAGVLPEESESLDELISIVDSLVLEDSSPVHFNFKETLIRVLLMMPEEAMDYLINGRILSFVIPYNGIIAVRALTPGHYLCVDPYWYAKATDEASATARTSGRGSRPWLIPRLKAIGARSTAVA